MKVPEEKKERVPNQVPNTMENFQMCICVNCPTYNPCMKERNQRLFCSRGKTECALVRAGCICGECPVSSRYSLHGYYFCDDEEGVKL